MEADFQRYYSIDLADALYGEKPMSMRKIFMLWRHLPGDSAVSRAMDPEGYVLRRWETSDHFLALISEQIDAIAHMYAQTHSKNKPKWKAMRHLRPAKPDFLKETPKRRRNANASEIYALLRGEM